MNRTYEFLRAGDAAAAAGALSTLRGRTDGCLAGPRPDRGDWVSACSAQAELVTGVDALLAALRSPG